MKKSIFNVLVPALVIGAIPLTMVLASLLYGKANPQAMVTSQAEHSVVIAETGRLREGFPVRVKLVTYTFTSDAGLGVWDGKPATRFCKGSGFPSHQMTCRYSTMPFDPSAVGRQQEVDFNSIVFVR